QDRYYLRKTLSEIRRQPIAYLRLLAAKLVWLVQAEEVRDSHSFYFFADRVLLLRILPGWSLLFPLACVGAVSIAIARLKASRRAFQASGLLFCYAVAVAISNVFLLVGFRYRMPLVPALAVAAGVAVASVADALRTHNTRAPATQAAAGVAAIAVGRQGDQRIQRRRGAERCRGRHDSSAGRGARHGRPIGRSPNPHAARRRARSDQRRSMARSMSVVAGRARCAKGSGRAATCNGIRRRPRAPGIRIGSARARRTLKALFARRTLDRSILWHPSK